MPALWSHLQEVSTLGDVRSVFSVLLAIDLGLTLTHSLQELRGRLWRYFGDIKGVTIPDWLGVPSFFLGLTAALWAVGLLGIAGWWPLTRNPVSPATAMTAVGALIGARLSDSWFSHIRLHRAGFRPNPGLSSTPFYILEAVVLAALFARGLQNYPGVALAGFAGAAGLFAILLPLLGWLRGVLPEGWRREIRVPAKSGA